MIIGICGHMRSGKDTVASIFEYSYGFEHRSFAKPLKDACKIIFDWSDEHVNGSLKDKIDDRWGISPRMVLQLLGTEFGQKMLCDASEKFKKKVGRRLWVLRCLDGQHKNNIVISDVRFLHEAETIRKYKGKIIKIIRNGAGVLSTHASETELEKIEPDYTIDNNGTIYDLTARVEDIAKMLGIKK